MSEHGQAVDREILDMWLVHVDGERARISPGANPPALVGWMPAGTYLPLGDRSPEGLSPEMKWAHRLMRRALGHLGPTGPEYQGEDLRRGLHVTMPTVPSRRLPSRTLTWSNLGDDYDLLPDAD